MQSLDSFISELEAAANSTEPAQEIIGAKTYLCSVKGPSRMLDNDDYEYFHEITADSEEAALAKITSMMTKEAHSPRVIREIIAEPSIFDIIEEDE